MTCFLSALVAKVKMHEGISENIIYIVILHNNKEYLWSLFEEMKQYIATLKLSFKDNYQIFKVEDRGISFVGYVIRHDYTLVRKNIKRSMCRKAARLGRKKHITVYSRRLQTRNVQSYRLA